MTDEHAREQRDEALKEGVWIEAEDEPVEDGDRVVDWPEDEEKR